MIQLNTISPKPLGDTIDTIFLGHMLSKLKNDRVNIVGKLNDTHVINKLIGFGDVVFNQLGTIPSRIEVYDFLKSQGKKYYTEISKKFGEIPLNKNIQERDIDLPEKFITTQWDAGQLYRLVDRWDKQRISNIEKYYTDQGFKIIRIGGQGQYKKLEDIIYIISKATYHVGADSGMMHIAKFLLPIENIHVYINIRERKDDPRFPDEWNVAWMAREIFRRGAKMNLCENPSQEQIDYFKKVEVLWA